MKKAIVTALRYGSLIGVLILGLISVNGSGGGSDGGDDASNSGETTTEELRTVLKEQSDAGKTFFKAFEETILLMEELDQMIDSSDLGEESNRDALAEIIESDIPAALQKMETSGSLLVETENDLQRIGSGKSSKVLPVLVVACGAAVAAYSWAETLNDNFRVYKENLDNCLSQYKAGIGSIPSGLDQNAMDQQMAYHEALFQQCINHAKDVMDYEDNKTHYEALLSTLLAEAAPVGGFGRNLIQATSSALDVTNIYILGTSEDKSQKGRSTKDETGPTHFISKSDENGEFYAPIGDWQLVFFKPGYLRVMTQANEPFNVSSDRTNQALLDMPSIEDVTFEDLNRCAVNDDDDDDIDDGDDGSADTDVSYSGEYNYYIESVITEPQYFRNIVCDYDGPANIVANADGSLTVEFGEENRDSLCAMPFLEPSGTHSGGRFTIPLGQITLTGTLDNSSLTGSGSYRVNQGSGYTETVISLDLNRQ